MATLRKPLVGMLVLVGYWLPAGSAAPDPDPTRALVVIQVLDDREHLVNWGQGFFLADDLLATSFAVLQEGSSVRVVDGGGEEFAVRGWVYADREQDLVLLQTQAGTAYLRLARTQALSRGEPLEVLGLWDADQPIPAEGVCTAEIDGTMWHRFRAALPNGSNGAALVDEEGFVRGMVSFGLQMAPNTHFACPARALRLGIVASGAPRPLADLESVPGRRLITEDDPFVPGWGCAGSASRDQPAP